MQEFKTTDDTITISVDGADRPIKMYYGLLNELLNLTKDLNNVGGLFTDPQTRNAALIAILSERDSKGNITKSVSPTDVNLSIGDIERVLAWAGAHVTGFFIRSLTALTKQLSQLPNDQTQST